MNDNCFDIIVVTDPRFQGGTSSAVTAEITAAVQNGYHIGLVSFEAINISLPFPFNAKLRHLIDRNQVTLIVPGTSVRCRLAILHNPYVAGLINVEPLQIQAEKRLVVVHHPPIDGFGLPSYDLATTVRNAEEILAGPADWVPVGPNARRAFFRHADAPTLLRDDWTNVIDLDAWRHTPQPRKTTGTTIGRHSRPDPRKFPGSREAFEQIYGDGSHTAVDLLGCPPEIISLLGPVPTNWTLRPFDGMLVPEYLDGLDAFVYFHREDWIEAFGYTVLEAMARGLPCILPTTLEPSFGSAAKITTHEEALTAALDVVEDPHELREAGYDLVHDHHSFDAVARRLHDLIGPPKKELLSLPTMPKSEPGVLLVSTNGIGMGHLTRTIAIARRLQAPIKPVIVTMSHGASVAEDFGYHVEFIPYHNYLGTHDRPWNTALREEMKALIDAHGARVVLFDGNSPFEGLIDAVSERPHVWSIWSRRGMWRPNSGADFINRENKFDAVIEPHDLASAFDVGLTTISTNRTRHTEPIRLLDGHELLPRHLARKELGLDPDATNLLVQLGGGNNFDMRLSRDLVLQHLRSRPDVQIVLIGWKISATSPPKKMPKNAIMLSAFPIARYLNAFDATVSAVGYNSYHEITQACLPAVYVPNENPSQDNQLARANFAARHGSAIVARRDQPENLIQALEVVLDPDRRSLMARAARELSRPNGAIEAADIVTQFANTYRGFRES